MTIHAQVWTQVEDKLANAIADIAIELIAAGTRYAIRKIRSVDHPSDTPSEDKGDLFSCIPAQEPVHFDTLKTRCNMEAGILSASLLMLQLQGKIMQVPGDRYVRAN